MIPKDSNRHEHSTKHGCTPVSSGCVIWNGPDIPCINLCKGDAIDEVVYQLATLLCQVADGVIDITTLDFKCLVEENATEPTRLIQILQLIIDKHCELAALVEGGTPGGGGGVTPPAAPIPLPACLYYEDADGDTITSLLPAAYSAYLAEKICEILTVIAGLTTNYTNLVNRVESIEDFLENLNINASIPDIISKCITAATPGEEVPITDAVSAMETFLCQLSDLLGNFNEISTVIDTECVNLDITPSFSNPEVIMSELSGWTVNPTNLSQNLINLWLTLCDMRGALVDITGEGALPCATVSPYMVKIGNKTTNSFTVSWNAAPIAGTEPPTSYVITAVEWNGSAEVGLPLFTQTVPANVLTYTFTGPASAEKLYIVKVTALYSCGESEPATIVDQVVIGDLKYKATVSDVLTDSDTTLNCLAAGYLAKTRTTRVKLTDLFLGNMAVNVGVPIEVVVRYSLAAPDCADFTPTTEDVTITINPGQSEASYTYYSQGPLLCGEVCVDQYKTFSCVVSVSGTATVLAPGTTTC